MTTEGRLFPDMASRLIRRYGYAKVLRHAREAGVRETVEKAALVPVRWCGWGRSYLAARAFDRRHGLRTSGQVSLEDLARDGLPVEDSHAYLPTPMNVIPDVLSRLAIDCGTFTFVDLGSGKGAALLAAAEMNFRRIIGVEFSRSLQAISVANVRTYRRERHLHGEIDILNIDVRDFEFPDDRLVVYAFNPFEADLLCQVIEKLAMSYRNKPRKMFLVYLNATRKINPRAIVAKFGFMAEIPVFGHLDRALFYARCPFPVAVWTTAGA